MTTSTQNHEQLARYHFKSHPDTKALILTSDSRVIEALGELLLNFLEVTYLHIEIHSVRASEAREEVSNNIQFQKGEDNETMLLILSSIPVAQTWYHMLYVSDLLADRIYTGDPLASYSEKLNYIAKNSSYICRPEYEEEIESVYCT